MSAGHPAGADGLVPMLRRRVDGTFEVDEWGLDPDLVALVEPVAGVRWRVSVDGGQHVPTAGPAMVVHNRRAGLSEPFVVARAVRLATGRHARPVGRSMGGPNTTRHRRPGSWPITAAGTIAACGPSAAATISGGIGPAPCLDHSCRPRGTATI